MSKYLKRANISGNIISGVIRRLDSQFERKFSLLFEYTVPSIGSMEYKNFYGYYLGGTTFQLFSVGRASYSSNLSITVNYQSGSKTLTIPNVFVPGISRYYVYVNYSQDFYPNCFVRVARQDYGIVFEGTLALDTGKTFYSSITCIEFRASTTMLQNGDTGISSFVFSQGELPIDFSLLDLKTEDAVQTVQSWTTDEIRNMQKFEVIRYLWNLSFLSSEDEVFVSFVEDVRQELDVPVYIGVVENLKDFGIVIWRDTDISYTKNGSVVIATQRINVEILRPQESEDWDNYEQKILEIANVYNAVLPFSVVLRQIYTTEQRQRIVRYVFESKTYKRGE